uniref:YbaK/EbsC family protein n=1 Tax=Enterocloster clostridioformis TaxID=1531 RepID=UPI0026749A35|nr:YbaK/EbsC family protein [Enterocloster clostridioformis]
MAAQIPFTSMSFQNVKTYFEGVGLADHITVHSQTGDTVEHAAEAVGCSPAEIAKSLTFLVDGKPVMIVMAGDTRVNSSKFKAYFHQKPSMVPYEQVGELIGHQPGAVCPFAIREDVTVYGILTMIGAMATGFLIVKFKMKNVPGSVYGIRVLISLFMLLFPKGFAFAIIITGFLGITGGSTVPPTAGLITKQFGAFFSSWLGGCCFTTYGNYTLPWVVNTVLCLIASVASFSIKEETV